MCLKDPTILSGGRLKQRVGYKDFIQLTFSDRFSDACSWKILPVRVKIHRKVYQLLRVRSRIGVNLQYFINDATWNILVQFFFVLGRFPVRNP